MTRIPARFQSGAHVGLLSKFTIIIDIVTVRRGGEGVEAALPLHDGGPLADALAGVFLAQATERINCRMQIVAQDYTVALNQN